tara:strand:- start:326 stop:1057 length:732 start_codon:yes stop_codon:yes gene_type:complete
MKTMKTITSKFKIALVAIGLLTIGSMSAQTKDAASANVIKDTPADGAVVRVIDNKGTIKYLQTNNGITSITSTTTNNKTTTTWQLGGTLTDSTYIDVSDKIFALDGIKLITPTDGDATTLASTDAVTLSDGKVGGTAGGTGWAVLIRNEATGETQKILASDLITAGREEFPIAADGDVAVTASGLAAGTAISKISVYRNGAKLRASIDYNLTGADTITLTLVTTAPNDWTTYAGDIIEVQWIY